MMDGVPLAGANSTGQNRNFQFEQVSLTNLESIELTKGATPDMEGASIGGTINMTSKSAFDRAGGRIFTYGVGLAHWLGPNIRGTARWKQPFPGYGPSINLSYSDVFGEKRNLGIILTTSFNETPGPARVSSTMLFQPLTDPGPAYVYDLKTPSVSGTPQTRIGSSLRVDYRWSENTTVSFRTSINFYHENVDARTHTLHTSSTLATVDANGNRTGGGLINPNYSNNVTRAYAHPTSSYSNITTNTANRSGKTLVFHPSVRHRFENLSIDYGVSASRWESFIDYGQNVPKFKSRPRGTVDVRLANIGWIVDRSKDGVWPTVTQTEGADLYNLNNYAGLTLGQNQFRGYTTVVGSKIDVRRSFDWKLPTYLKTGVSYRQQSRKIWRDPLTFNYAGPDGVLGNADDSGHLAQFLDTSGYYEEANT
jgi:hypothetical protein